MTHLDSRRISLIFLAFLASTAASAEVDVTVLGQDVTEIASIRMVSDMLMVIDDETNHVGYVQWVRPEGSDPGAAIVHTKPYVGIDWTGEWVDLKWAARGPGLYPDDDQPDFDPATSADISYTLSSPASIATECVVFALQDVGCLFVFGRFYAGGSLVDDVLDMRAGMRFLETLPSVTPETTAIYGGSWGGFEALFGTLYASPLSRPSSGVVLYPLSDLVQEWAHMEAAIAQSDAERGEVYANFYEPYRRRIVRAVVAEGLDPQLLTHDAIVAGGVGPFSIYGDSEDTMVPATMPQHLVALSTQMRGRLLVSAQPRTFADQAPTHGDTIAQHLAAVKTLVDVELLAGIRLAQEARLAIGSTAELTGLLQTLRQQADEGHGFGGFEEALSAAVHSQVMVFDLDTNQTHSGVSFVTGALNAAYEVALTEAEVLALFAFDP